MIKAADIIRRVVQAALKPRPVERMWEWIDKHVIIPLSVGSTNPGPLKTSLVPPMRGLYDLFAQKKVHFFTLAKSARVGGTLFCLCCLMHKLVHRPGPVMWVDPTRKTASRFSRAELQPHLLECEPVARIAIISRTTWTTLEMFFRAATLGVVGAGSAPDLGGRQAEFLVLNERDKMKQDMKAEAPPAQLAIQRTKQFLYTRKILENSTPTLESADTWQNFLAGSQHHCYVPCPHCSGTTAPRWKPPEWDQCALGRSPQSYDPALKGWQYLTFFETEKEVPFDEDGNPLPEGKTRIEKTGKFYFGHCKKQGREDYDLAKVEQDTQYECVHCQKKILHTDLNWMLRRFWWRAHNPKAPVDHISAHWYAAYSPFEHWGQLGKKFLQARGSISKMHDFYNSDLGLPFVRHATTIREDDIDRIIKRSPEYFMGQLPAQPMVLTMCVDVQGFGFWWSIRAWGILWDVPGWPTWSALIDCGPAVSWDQIEELAGLKALDDGSWNRYKWADPETKEVHEYQVTAGLIDSGFEAQQGKKVYEFCMRHAHVFSPSKGGSRQHLRGKFVTETLVADNQLKLVWYWDDHFKQQLYYEAIKEGKVHWWLPRDAPPEYRAQLTAERTQEVKQKNGSIALEWVVEGEQGNHLGDTEKEHEVLRETIEAMLEEVREEKRKQEELES